MSGKEDYEKLRGELGKIFLEGVKDELLLDSLSDSLDSKEVLEIAKELKGEGNSLFKLGKFEDALECYGNAEIVLVGHKFEAKANRSEFCDLALCILLNSAACFSKLKEFQRVTQVCSIILEFQPKNVKAMYRRAVAAIELGKNDWAYWDLVVAVEISPNNQDVVKKLEQVKDSIHRLKSQVENQVHCPKGIGLGLPPQKRISNDFLTERNAVDHKELVGKEDEGDHFNSSTQAETCRNFDNMEVSHSNYCQQVQEKEEMQKDAIKDEIMEEAGQWHSASKISSTVTEDANTLSSECNDEVSTPHNLEKPIYRFRNHNKKGSSLSISKSNYLLMTQGKSLNFYNPKLGSFMEVRIVTRQETKAAITSDYYFQDVASPVHCQNQSPPETWNQDHMDSEEVHSEVSSCVTSDIIQSEVCDDASSATQSPAVFKFSSMSNNKARKNHSVKSHSSPRVPVQKTKRRKLQLINHVPLLHTNFACDCRSEVGKKRKCASLLPLDSNHHPTKKPAPRACPMNQCILGPCTLCPCTNDCNAGITSNRCVCNAAQVLATRARKGS